jgi:hypothetical protein
MSQNSPYTASLIETLDGDLSQRVVDKDQWCADPLGVPLDQCCGLLDALAHHGPASVDRDALLRPSPQPGLMVPTSP